MSFINTVLAFLVAIALLVAVHEFGHYWVARKMGVKVLRFSIGFGRPLITKVAGEDRTEYSVAAIPLGGYVRMLDEREGNVAPDEVHRAFNRQPVGSRMAIVAAGPIFNFLLAIVLYALMYMVGVSGVKPMIGEIVPGSIAAQADVPPDTMIRSVNGKLVQSWSETVLLIVDQALETGELELQLEGKDGGVRSRTLYLTNVKELLDQGDLLEGLGIKAWRPVTDAVFGDLTASGPAARAGILPGDRVLSIDGVAITLWQELVDYVQAHPEAPLQFQIDRAGQRETILVRTERLETKGKTVGRIGAAPHMDRAMLEEMQVLVTYGPLESVVQGVIKTWDMSELTLRMMWKLVTGGVSASNISGPLSIAEYAGVTAGIGIAAFLGFLAMLSVSLGVLNLLPVPVLDGGHLLFYFIEWVKGSPLSEQAQAVGQQVGIVLLMGLMVFAFYNDLTRLFS